MSSVSDLILNSGPLSPIWIAGTMKDKIGKKVVLSTNISDVADKIIREDRISLVLRLSGMLLKGLVVVYSKKTQYMLSDCEDIIAKIMNSFKTSAVDLVPSATRGDETLTISINRQGQRAEINYAYGDINDWLLAQNPENEFIVRAEPIEFPTPSDNSVASTQLSDSANSSSAPPQALVQSEIDEDAPFIPPSPVPTYVPPAMPDWTNIPSDDDALPVVQADQQQSYQPPIDDNYNDDDIIPQNVDDETESDHQERVDRSKQRIVDNRIDLPNVRGQHRKRTRPNASRRNEALPQNEELEELFELARQEFAKPPPPVSDIDDNDIDDHN